MRIKEVEERTGLTAKAIRLYESKGLLKPARQSENDYRDYTEEDVQRLKTIAVLRKLDISIKEIKQWCDGEVELNDLLHRVSAEAMLEARKADDRLKLAQELAKVLDEEPNKPLPEAIEEAEELQELYQEIEEAREDLRADLFLPMYATILALGPVGWTVVRIMEGQADKALLSFGISLLVVPYVFYRWYRYFRSDRGRRKAGCLWFVPGAVGGIALGLASLFFVLLCQQKLFDPGTGWFLFRTPWMYIALIYPVFIIMEMASNRAESDDDIAEPEETPQQKRKYAVRSWCMVIAFNVLLYYGCITGVTYFHDDVFTRYSFFCPGGKTYELSDIEQVEAGFHGKWSLLPWENSGDFYYKITFSDGKTENWVDLDGISLELGDTTQEETDPWEELLKLDTILMEAGVQKISDWDNREDFQYDQSCLDICDTILNNK